MTDASGPAPGAVAGPLPVRMAVVLVCTLLASALLAVGAVAQPEAPPRPPPLSPTKSKCPKPASLRVIADWLFVIVDGTVTKVALQGGTVEDGSNKQKRKARIRAIRHFKAWSKKVKDREQPTGAVLLRYYEVLDADGERWRCNGKLSEVVTPADPTVDVDTGDTKVKKGIVQGPDQLFRVVPKGTAFTNLRLLQEISVDGCPVRYNEITMSKGAVTVRELTKAEYERELAKLPPRR